MESRIRQEVYVRFGRELRQNLPQQCGKAWQCLSHYDSAEGLLTAVILLVAEYLSMHTDEETGEVSERRHIISVFKLVQDLLAPSKVKGKNQFQILMDKLPSEHKARWFAGTALNSAEQAMASVLSTALSRLNAFIDSEMEQILCFDTALDTEKFCKEKSAVFICMRSKILRAISL